MLISRRGLIGGLLGLVAAPAVVRVESLMRVARVPSRFWVQGCDAYGNPVTEALGAEFGMAPAEFAMRDALMFTRLLTGRLVMATVRDVNDNVIHQAPLNQPRFVLAGDQVHLREMKIRIT